MNNNLNSDILNKLYDHTGNMNGKNNFNHPNFYGNENTFSNSINNRGNNRNINMFRMKSSFNWPNGNNFQQNQIRRNGNNLHANLFNNQG